MAINKPPALQNLIDRVRNNEVRLSISTAEELAGACSSKGQVAELAQLLDEVDSAQSTTAGRTYLEQFVQIAQRSKGQPSKSMRSAALDEARSELGQLLEKNGGFYPDGSAASKVAEQRHDILEKYDVLPEKRDGLGVTVDLQVGFGPAKHTTRVRFGPRGLEVETGSSSMGVGAKLKQDGALPDELQVGKVEVDTNKAPHAPLNQKTEMRSFQGPFGLWGAWLEANQALLHRYLLDHPALDSLFVNVGVTADTPAGRVVVNETIDGSQPAGEDAFGLNVSYDGPGDFKGSM